MNPPPVREPSCEHSNGKQPASACDTCSKGPRLKAWQDGWAAFFAAHPDDPRNPARTKTGGGSVTRGGCHGPAAAPTVPTVVSLVIVATHTAEGARPSVVAGVPDNNTETAKRTAAMFQRNGWTDAHVARETVSYERLP